MFPSLNQHKNILLSKMAVQVETLVVRQNNEINLWVRIKPTILQKPPRPTKDVIASTNQLPATNFPSKSMMKEIPSQKKTLINHKPEKKLIEIENY